jgi:NAD(P)H dehydrogenase (quinone)
MILVTGATGHLGSAVIDYLAAHSAKDQFIALARSATKAAALKARGIQVRIADFDQPDSLREAFKAVDKVLLISTMENNRLEQHINVIDAAKQAGVKHVLYTGLAIQNIATSQVRELMQSHFQTEDYLAQSGLDYTFLRNSMYADAIPLIVGEAVLQRGIYLPGGAGKVPYVLRREMGEAAARVLLEAGHAGKTYHIAGSRAYSYAEVAEQLTRLSGKPVDYVDADPDEFVQNLQKFGLPEFLIYLTSGTVLDIKAHQYEVAANDLAQILGRESLSLQDMLQELYKF